MWSWWVAPYNVSVHTSVDEIQRASKHFHLLGQVIPVQNFDPWCECTRERLVHLTPFVGLFTTQLGFLVRFHPANTLVSDGKFILTRLLMEYCKNQELLPKLAWSTTYFISGSLSFRAWIVFFQRGCCSCDGNLGDLLNDVNQYVAAFDLRAVFSIIKWKSIPL